MKPKTKIKPVQAWAWVWLGRIDYIKLQPIKRMQSIPVTIIPSADYRSMVKELREIKRQLKCEQDNFKTLLGG